MLPIISSTASSNMSITNEENVLSPQVTIPLTYRLQLLHYSDSEAGFLAPQTAPYLAALVDGFDNTHAGTYQESCPLGVLELCTSKQLTSICALGSS